jgi:hypothetical protein
MELLSSVVTDALKLEKPTGGGGGGGAMLNLIYNKSASLGRYE